VYVRAGLEFESRSADWKGPWRVVHEHGTSRENGNRLLADGYVIREEEESRIECRWHGTAGDDRFPCRAPGETGR